MYYVKSAKGLRGPVSDQDISSEVPKFIDGNVKDLNDTYKNYSLFWLCDLNWSFDWQRFSFGKIRILHKVI